MNLAGNSNHIAIMEIMNVSDYERMAKEKLPKMVYDFYASGADDQWTLKENSNAFSKILLRPRVLVNVSSIDTSITIFGSKISMPIMVAPVALQKLAHPEGECATAKATSAVGTAMAQSAWSTSSIEEVAESGPGVRILQIYATKDRNIMLQLVKRAEKAGVQALIMTVDNARLSRREADIKNRFDLPLHLTLKNFEYLNLDENYKNGSRIGSYVTLRPDPSFDWKDLQWLQTMTHLPILLKGVVTAEDAKLAIEANVSGIIVSNHGARQLDYVPPTIMILEEIVGAVEGKIPVFIDGGIRRGTDIFKSLALGASGVFIGRPTVFSLAVDGEMGVRKMLQKLRDELELTMALSGCRSIQEITRNHIRLPIKNFEE